MFKKEFAELISVLKSDDALTYENGYHGLIDHVDEFLDKLIDLEQKKINK